jgi:hypothetical protein
MSIIYSYPTTSPTLDDLLIGTDVGEDNATKSFTVQSLVSLVNAAQNNGILTSVTISTDSFLRAEGNPTGPAVAYTIGLAATGTPSATTFLRGDNQWVVPTVSAGISVSQDNVTVTNDVQGFNFTGIVSVSDGGDGLINVNVDPSVGLVTSVSPGLGIEILSTTGDVTVTNTGILSIAQGNGILATTANGITTISTTGQSSGTVISVQPGLGLQLEGTGTVSVNPTIGLNYSGTGNFINSIPAGSAATALPADTILFEQETSGDIKSTTWGELQATTLSLVNTEITTADERNVKNSTDNGATVARVNNIVTLLQSEYDAVGFVKVANTLYLTKAGAASTTFTKQHIITDGVINPLSATYTITSTVPNGTSVTRAENTQESWTTSLALSDTSSYRFSSSAPLSITPNPNVVDFTNNNSVTTSITGTIEAVPVGQCTTTLSILNDVTGNGATEGVDYNITYTGALSRTSTSGCSQALNPDTTWGVVLTMVAGTGTGVNAIGTDKYVLNSVSYTYNPANPTTYGTAATVTCLVTAEIVLKSFNIDYTVTDSITPTGNHTLLTTSTITAWNNSSSTGVYPQASLLWGSLGFQVATSASPSTNYQFTSGPSYAYTGTSYGPPIYDNRVITLDITGNTAVATGYVERGAQDTSGLTLNGGSYSGINIGNEYRILDTNGTVVVDFQYYTGTNVTINQPVGYTVETYAICYPQTGTVFPTAPTYTFDGTVYTLGTTTRTLVATTILQAGQNLLPSASYSGNAVTISAVFMSNGSGTGNVVCGYQYQTSSSFYSKGTGNSSFYAQVGDTVYSNNTGSPTKPTNFYKIQLDSGSGNGSGVTYNTEVFINNVGVITNPSICSIP